MSSPMTLAGFPDILDPTMREIWDGTFAEGEDIIPRLYTVATPKLATEKGSALTGIGPFSEFNGVITYDGADQGYSWSSTFKEYAKGIMVARTLVLYDQFNVIEDMFRLLAESARDTRQEEAVQTFVNAFTLDSGYSTDEGVALCSDAHTSPRSGVSTTVGFDNLTTSAFSPLALKAIYIQLRKLRKDNGQPIDNLVGDTVIGPVDLIDRAQEIFSTIEGLDSAEGTANVLKGRYTYLPLIRLTNTTNYFVVNNALMKKNLIWFDKVKPEFSRVEDFDTLVAKYRGYFVCHRARKDWRWIVGAQVS